SGGRSAPRDRGEEGVAMLRAISAGLPDVPAAAGHEVRVFVSSTFRDLQAEREHLIKQVFPELRLRCRARGVEFTEIDLRWGITEEATAGKVLRVCLDEIDRCRPYFLGVLGDRYGWVPDPADVDRSGELTEGSARVREGLAAG